MNDQNRDKRKHGVQARLSRECLGVSSARREFAVEIKRTVTISGFKIERESYHWTIKRDLCENLGG